MKRSIFLILLISAPLAWAGDNYQQMDRLFRTKQYSDLENICQNRLKANSRSLDSYYFLSLMKLNQGKGQDAVDSMMNFEKYHNEIETEEREKKGKGYNLVDAYYMDLYYFLGQYYVGQKKFDRALVWLGKAKPHYSDDPAFHFFYGRCYAGQGDYASAAKEFQKQALLEPKDPSSAYNVASCYAQQGKAGDTVEWLKKAVAIDTKYKEQASKDESFKKVKGAKAFQDLIAP